MSLDDRLKNIDLEIRPLMVGATKYADEAIVTGKPEAKQAILTDLLEITDSLQNDDGWIDREVLRDKVRKYCE